MAKDPAFLFYYQDFLVGTEFMEEAEVGIYIRILCHQADKGHLPEKHILSICRAYGFTDNVKNKFVKDNNGLYYNERLEEELIKRRNFTESRRNNASKGKAYAKHMENENENINKDINILDNYSLNLLKEYNKGKAMTNEEVYSEYFLQYIPESLHNQQFLEVWADWVHYRRKIKKKLTEDSVKRQIKFLLKQPDPIACIDNSIQNSYQGLFEVKNGLPQNNQTPVQPSTTKMSPEVQKQREFLANKTQNNN